MMCVRWWADCSEPPLAERVSRRMKEWSDGAFTVIRKGRVMAKTDQNLGEAYMALDEGMVDELLEAVREQDGLGYAFQVALEEWPDSTSVPGAEAHARVLMTRLVAIAVGKAVKKSPEFSRFDDDIQATRERIGEVVKVMES